MKKFLSVLLASVFIISTTGCNNNNKNENTTEDSELSQEQIVEEQIVEEGETFIVSAYKSGSFGDHGYIVRKNGEVEDLGEYIKRADTINITNDGKYISYFEKTSNGISLFTKSYDGVVTTIRSDLDYNSFANYYLDPGGEFILSISDKEVYYTDDLQTAAKKVATMDMYMKPGLIMSKTKKSVIFADTDDSLYFMSLDDFSIIPLNVDDTGAFFVSEKGTYYFYDGIGYLIDDNGNITTEPIGDYLGIWDKTNARLVRPENGNWNVIKDNGDKIDLGDNISSVYKCSENGKYLISIGEKGKNIYLYEITDNGAISKHVHEGSFDSFDVDVYNDGTVVFIDYGENCIYFYNGTDFVKILESDDLQYLIKSKYINGNLYIHHGKELYIYTPENGTELISNNVSKNAYEVNEYGCFYIVDNTLYQYGNNASIVDGVSILNAR